MRLIDCDAFKADYRMADECKDCKTPVRACEYDRVYTKMDFCSWLDDAPTIEPEQKKGHWIHKGCGCFECDQCGELVSTNVYIVAKASERFKFCPSCGSDMRGSEQDE